MYWIKCIDGYVDIDKAFSIIVESNDYGKIFIVARFSSNPNDGITLMDFTNRKEAFEFLERLKKDIEENKKKKED